MENVEALRSTVARVAGWYSRRVTWLDPDDFEQEAWLTACELVEKCDLEGDALRGYAFRAISRNLQRFCCEQISPVSASKPTEETKHYVRVAISSCCVEAGSVEAEFMAKEAELVVSEKRQLLRSRVSEICCDNELGIGVLLEGEKPRELARKSGIPVSLVYKGTERLKRAICADSESVEILSCIKEYMS